MSVPALVPPSAVSDPLSRAQASPRVGRVAALKQAVAARDAALLDAAVTAWSADDPNGPVMALQRAAGDGWMDGVRLLLQRADAPDERGVGAAMAQAVAGGHADLVALLAPRAAALHVCPVLTKAALLGDAACVRALLPQVARTSAAYGRPPQLKTAILSAVSQDDAVVLAALLEVVDAAAGDSIALTAAAGQGRTALVRMLMPLSDANANNGAALAGAAAGGHLACVRLLMEVTAAPLVARAVGYAIDADRRDAAAMLLTRCDGAQVVRAMLERREFGRAQAVGRLLDPDTLERVVLTERQTHHCPELTARLEAHRAAGVLRAVAVSSTKAGPSRRM